MREKLTRRPETCWDSLFFHQASQALEAREKNRFLDNENRQQQNVYAWKMFLLHLHRLPKKENSLPEKILLRVCDGKVFACRQGRRKVISRRLKIYNRKQISANDEIRLPIRRQFLVRR